MRQHSNLAKDTAEKVVKDIRRATRKQYSAENECRPGELRTGSPPSPPPRLIRPNVRLLPRSPRLSGPGPL
jgi:hypothetical protein